jgi:hypothetical protein
MQLQELAMNTFEIQQVIPTKVRTQGLRALMIQQNAFRGVVDFHRLTCPCALFRELEAPILPVPGVSSQAPQVTVRQ